MRRLLAALAASALPFAASAQAPAKPKPPAQAPANPAAPAAPAAAPNKNGPQPDLPYGAYQRGYFTTAFSLATKQVEYKADPRAMTLLGEIYAQGLGLPQNDQKAAEWYKLAADRGDRDAMFALAMFRLAGRAGPRDRDASAKYLAAAAKLGHALAAYDLALLYIEGQLFPQDFARGSALSSTCLVASEKAVVK